MTHTDDGYYIDKIRTGNPASYAFLVNKYKDMVYGISIKILRDGDEAQDSAQDCFIKAYQQIHRFEGKSKFSTWLYTIAYRTAINKLKENRVDTKPIDDADSEMSDHLPSQFDLLQSKQVQQIVKTAIQKLPQIDALLVTLYYINDLPIKEIEEITGLSRANVKIKLFRARKTLERDLKFLIDNEMKGSKDNE